jgi:PAS domain S-box-containing protein
MTHEINANISETIFVGGGEMGTMMRSHDWSQTPLGLVETWPQSLRSALSICLNSRFPIAIYWGQDCILLYNDAWRPIVGDKHSWALGHPAREVWSEIWDDIGPELASVLATGEGTFHKDELLSMYRFGYTEECFFEYTFNPIQGQGGVIDGVFNVVSETTYRVLNDRRARLLREVASKTGIAKTVEAASTLMLETFKSDPLDIPLALLYLIDPDGKHARLCNGNEFALDNSVSPAVVDLAAEDDPNGWPLTLTARTAQVQGVTALVSRFGALPGSPWAEPPQEAMVLPIAAPGYGKVSGVLVAVASPRRRLDDNYRDFFIQVAGQVAMAIANAQAYEEECKRAEALAELDRAKTAFFSNVSHEFRTPLTLMLSPLEELSNSLHERLQPDEREQLQLVQRNGLRLQKLVNTLLDFSRIEARRMEVSYEPIDLANYTAELASTFRSLIEQAEMQLVIDCPPLSEPVYVDREMWEKVVLNLLSNAFKFTFTGEIRVSLRLGVGEWESGGVEESHHSITPSLHPPIPPHVILEVQDTGVGIPAVELPRLFERFHRVSGTKSRTYEGSGIGLSLVQELVKLHQGTIAVTSVEGEGTCFTISIPTGTNHLPQDRINTPRSLAAIPLAANAYLEEALRWLPEEGNGEWEMGNGERILPLSTAYSPLPPPFAAKILLVDDNADMRDYVKRLLSRQYEVAAVSDGLAALSAIRHSAVHQRIPDLILTDVMMPNLDGFGLLQALRTDPQTREIPIILLSARAGEESRIEGLAAGADDYLIKPFSARELLARVEATLKLAQLRRESAQTLQRSEERYRAFVEQSSEGIWRFEVEHPLPIDCSKEEQLQHFYQYAYLAECNQVAAQMYGTSSPQDLVGARLADFLVLSDPRNLEYLRAFIRAGYHLIDVESYEVDRQGNSKFFLNNLVGIVEDGKLVRVWGTQRDITDRKQAEAEREQLLQREQALRSSAESAEAKLNELLASIREDFVLFDHQWHVAYLNPQAATTMQMPGEAVLGRNFWDLFPDLVGTEFYNRLHQVRRDQTPDQFEYYYPTWDCWFENRLYPAPEGVVALCSNITNRKRAELNGEFLNHLDAQLRQLSDADEMLWEAISQLGEYLNVDRCLWHDVDPGKGLMMIEQDWRRQEVPSALGVRLLSDFAVPELVDRLHAGETIVVSDVTTNPHTAPLADNYLPFGTRAFVTVPCIYKGHWVASLVANVNTVRHWRSDEVALLQEIVARLWSMIEHARAVQELRQSEAKFRQLANAMPQLVWVADGKGQIEFVNDRWTEYTGLTFEQTLDLQSQTHIIPAEDIQHMQASFASALETRSAYTSEFRLIQPDGTYRYFLVRATPIQDEQGRLLKWYGTSTDVTELKQLEIERVELLRQEQTAREAAEQANRIKDEFLAVLSHELRSPLTPILGWSELLRNGKLDATKTAQALATIERNAKLQAELIENLLDVSRILGGKLSLKVKPVDLASTIQAAIETVRLAAEAKSIDLRFTILDFGLEINDNPKSTIHNLKFNKDNPKFQVSGDSTRLQQVVWNLLSNAVKFTPIGGRVEVRLSLVNGHSSLVDDREVEPGTNDQGLRTKNTFAQIIVTDTGKGIHPNFLPHVFDYFRQEDGATTRRFGGLGLGLAIVHHLVELHGGTVSAESPGDGQGATFTVRLPLLRSKGVEEWRSGAPLRPFAPSPLRPLAGIQVLVVDDDADTRDFVMFLLEQAGAKVITSVSASEALVVLTHSKPNVLLSDIGMPEMDGYMLVRQVRALPPEQGGTIPAIALTAYARDFDEQKALQAGFQAHIAKPVESEVLVKAITMLLR